MNTNPGEAVRTAFANLSPDGTAKILFTSGSTGVISYINQRRVLARRADLVDMLYADPVPTGVVVAERTS
jgi:acyl-CoA synthetase (AMP-forming)/AMP-acid ligase II